MSIYTKLPNVPDSDDVRPGMASYYGSGPFGATCGICTHRGYFRPGKSVFNEQTGMLEETQRKTMGCKEFLRLSHRHGPVVDKDWSACKYFEAKPQPPPKPAKASDYGCVSVSAVDLRDTIMSIRSRRRFGAKSEAFLDGLLQQANLLASVAIGERRWRWLAGLAQQAGLSGGKQS